MNSKPPSQKQITARYRDTVVYRVRAYEWMLFGGSIVFPLLKKEVRLKRNVRVKPDHQSVTPEVLRQLAHEQKVGFQELDWAEPVGKQVAVAEAPMAPPVPAARIRS